MSNLTVECSLRCPSEGNFRSLQRQEKTHHHSHINHKHTHQIKKDGVTDKELDLKLSGSTFKNSIKYEMPNP